MRIYPSLISSDILRLADVIESLKTHCDGYHIDIMDGHFVPNITWGAVFANAISRKTSLPLHIHLMVTQPSSVIKNLVVRPFDCVSFHVEALPTSEQIFTTIEQIEAQGARVGLAISPKTSIEALLPYVAHIDEVLLMSVEPGASGQSFLPESIAKIEALMLMKKAHRPLLNVVVDGGITVDIIAQLAAMGVNACGIASAIFSQPDPIEALKTLYDYASV